MQVQIVNICFSNLQGSVSLMLTLSGLQFYNEKSCALVGERSMLCRELFCLVTSNHVSEIV